MDDDEFTSIFFVVVVVVLLSLEYGKEKNLKNVFFLFCFFEDTG